MGEIGHTVARLYLARYATLCKFLLLKLHHIEIFRHLLKHVQIHIDIRSGKVFHSGKTLTILACSLIFLYQFLWKSLASLVMLGINVKHLGLESPVLVDLRRQLHEVTLHSCHGLIMHVTHERM